jgi:hypothetical protein
MAVRIDHWITQRQAHFPTPATPTLAELSRQERLARLHRRRRLEQARSAVESAAWIAGGGLVLLTVWAGLFGLR